MQFRPNTSGVPGQEWKPDGRKKCTGGAVPEALCITPDLFLLQQMNLQNIYLAEISMGTRGMFCTGRHICVWESLRTGTMCDT